MLACIKSTAPAISETAGWESGYSRGWRKTTLRLRPSNNPIKCNRASFSNVYLNPAGVDLNLEDPYLGLTLGSTNDPEDV